MILRFVAILASLGAATALAAQSPPFERGLRHPPMGSPHGGRQFISPMGQPFRDAPDNAAAWFAAADTDHDGRLTLAEFRADAMRFFATLDIDADREIGPDEVDRYEREIAPETGSGGGMGDVPFPSGEQGGGGRESGGRGGGPPGGEAPGGGGGPGGGMAGHPGVGRSPPQGGGSGSGAPPAFDPGRQGAARFSYLALPEPVIAADSDFNRGVSDKEFLQAASRRFALLDANHDGVITAEELPRVEDNGRRGRRGPKPPPGA